MVEEVERVGFEMDNEIYEQYLRYNTNMICRMSDYVPNSKQDRSFFDRKKQAVKNLDKHYKKIKLDPSGHFKGKD